MCSKAKETNILVFDMGGGTFDAASLQLLAALGPGRLAVLF